MADKNKLGFVTVLASSIHDMKNSLGVVLSAIDELCTSRDDKGGCQLDAEKISALQYEANRVNNDLIRLLALYRLEGEHYALDIDEVFVIDLLEECLAKNSQLLAANDVQAEIECDDSMIAYLDRDLMTSVIDNVIFNVMRYTNGQLLLRAEQRGDFTSIFIEDDGPGYPLEFLEFGAERGTELNMDTGNTGLGLYFASQVAERHRQGDSHGHIYFSNGGRLGGGVFAIAIP